MVLSVLSLHISEETMSGFSDAPTPINDTDQPAQPKQEKPVEADKEHPLAKTEPKTVSGGFGSSNRPNRRGSGGWGGN